MPRGEVAAIVFASIKDPLYLVPRRLLCSDKHNTEHLSNSQRDKLNRTFTVGDNVEFNLTKNGQMCVIEKCTKVRDLRLSPDGKNVVIFFWIIILLEVPFVFLNL